MESINTNTNNLKYDIKNYKYLNAIKLYNTENLNSKSDKNIFFLEFKKKYFLNKFKHNNLWYFFLLNYNNKLKELYKEKDFNKKLINNFKYNLNILKSILNLKKQKKIKKKIQSFFFICDILSFYTTPLLNSLFNKKIKSTSYITKYHANNFFFEFILKNKENNIHKKNWLINIKQVWWWLNSLKIQNSNLKKWENKKKLEIKKKIIRYDNNFEFNSYKILNNKFSFYILHINISFNNTRITVTKQNGNVLFWSTCGHRKFLGSKKSTFVATNSVVNFIHNKIIYKKYTNLKIVFKGGSGRHKSRLRSILQLFFASHKKKKLNILSIINLTPISYNGCKIKKVKR